MITLAIIIITISQSFGERLDSPKVTPINQVLKALESAQSLSAPKKNYCNSQNYFFIDKFNKSLSSKNICDRPLKLDDICTILKKSAKSNIENQMVTYGSNNLQIRKKIISFTLQKFNNFKNDPEIQNICCKSNIGCKQQFKKTKLIFIKTTKPQNTSSNYYFNALTNGGSIRIYEENLVGLTSEQRIERLLLHELGHACQLANYKINGSAIGQFYNYYNCLNINPMKEQLGDILGSEIANCVVDEIILAAAKSQKNNFTCISVWGDEAFANAVFFTKRNTLEHFTHDCGVKTDFMHPPATYYACLLPQIQNQLCKQLDK